MKKSTIYILIGVAVVLAWVLLSNKTALKPGTAGSTSSAAGWLGGVAKIISATGDAGLNINGLLGHSGAEPATEAAGADA